MLDGTYHSAVNHFKNSAFRQRLRNSLTGIAHALSSERSLKFQVFAFGIALAALFFMRPHPIWWALVFESAGAVFASELLNTALEHLADHLHPAEHEQIRLVKDCAAGAVLLASIASVGVAAALLFSLYRGG